MAKVKNVSGGSVLVSGFGLVLAGGVLDVPDEQVITCTQQGLSWEQARAGEKGANWVPADKAAEKAHADAVAAYFAPNDAPEGE